MLSGDIYCCNVSLHKHTYTKKKKKQRLGTDWDNDNNGTCLWSTCCEKRGSRLDWSTEKEEEDMPLVVGTLNIRL